MTTNFSRYELSSGEAPNFVKGMDHFDISRAIASLDPISRVRFWSTFEPTVEFPYPSFAGVGSSIDDMAAVISGSKPATILTPGDLDTGKPAVATFLDFIRDTGDRLAPWHLLPPQTPMVA